MQTYKQRVISSLVDRPADLVGAAIDGYYAQMRHDPDAAAKLMIELPQVAKAYGGREVLTDYVLKEIILLVLEKFRHLSVNEIKTAYRMWSAGELETKGSAEVYGGSFNAGQVGKILAAYSTSRKEVIAKFLAEKHEADEQAADRQRSDAMKERYDAVLAEWWASRPEDWRDLPLHRCETAINRGWVTATEEEKAEILADARQIAEMELSGRIEEARGRGIRALGEMRQLQTMLEEKDSPLAQTIFSKLLVFRKHFLR